MSKRAIHLYEWDGGTEADQDPPEHVYCGTDGDMADEQLTNDWQYVTCKRCLKIHEKELAARAADDRDRKVKLFDEAQAITVDVGHLNVSTAVKALIAENQRLHQALQAITTQVEGNIRPAVRDCVNGQNNVQDIYGYCDQIESIAAAAMKELQP
jgi:hypothetical protein